MFPLTRHYVEWMEVRIGDVLDHYTVPSYQRASMNSHVDELYDKVKSYYEKHKDIMFTGSISVSSFEHGKEWMVFDGQHRLLVLQRLRKEYPIDSILIRVDKYTVSNDEEAHALYQIINQSEKVELYRSISESSASSHVEKWFMSNFDSYWKKSERPVLLNVNKNEVMKRMKACGYFDKPIHEIINALEKRLEFYKGVSDETWRLWGIDMDSKRKTLVTKDHFYFGLYRKYEWIPRLFQETQDHACVDVVRKRDALPKKRRIDVWNKRFEGHMSGKCYCCQKEISYQQGYHCGHIISVHDGGTNDLTNLEVVCSTCNEDMGTMNMKIYCTLFAE